MEMLAGVLAEATEAFCRAAERKQLLDATTRQLRKEIERLNVCMTQVKLARNDAYERSNQMHAHAQRKYRVGNHMMVQKKKARRDALLQRAHELEDSLHELRDQASRYSHQLWELGTESINDAYYQARYRYMEALYDAEIDDEMAQARKCRYIDALVEVRAISRTTEPEQIRYYRDENTIHVFYGGHIYDNSGSYVGPSPAGTDHGHSVLAQQPNGRLVHITSRKPLPPTLHTDEVGDEGYLWG